VETLLKNRPELGKIKEAVEEWLEVGVVVFAGALGVAEIFWKRSSFCQPQVKIFAFLADS
jgi:hypothetical protein